MDAKGKEITFVHLDPKMYGIPDNEAPEFYFYNMINRMMDDTKMSLDLRLGLSATAQSMNETNADLQTILKDKHLAWSTYKAATFTTIFSDVDHHISALHEVVDMIRDLYPEWPVLNTAKVKKALAL